MFDPKEIETAFGLHERSYRLLLWLNAALRRSAVRYDEMHGVLSSAEAAREWLTAQDKSLPADLRPKEAERAAFASHFVSFIQTSFEVVDQMLVPSCPGCTCCGFKKIGRRHLKARSLGPRAKETARELKRIYLESLAKAQGRPLTPEKSASMIEDPELGADVTAATYGQELLRRSSFRSQGEAVLALWRELKEPVDSKAWSAARRRKAKRKQALNAARVLDAEKRLAALIRQPTP